MLFSTLLALVLVIGGALYIGRRWGRSPQAYRAMIALAICYFVAGTVAGVTLMRATQHHLEPVASAVPAPVALPSLKPETLAPSLKPEGLAPSIPEPSSPPQVSEYDPARAVRTDLKLTPGDVFADARADEVCTPGWAREHRQRG